jgi:Putative binding domain, N-terminal
MRKLLRPGLLLFAVIAGCETKTPSGPSGNTPTTSTTTTTTAPVTTTTSSSTTSTIVLGSLVRRYSAFQAPPTVPSDMTLFFELIPAPAVATASAGSSRKSAFGITENEYKVTGVFVMGNGTTGTVTGELGEALNPLETGGEFEGTLLATTTAGCTGARDFDGSLSGQTLSWKGGATKPSNNPCAVNPLLAFDTMSMLRNDSSAPLPTTTSVATTTSSSTTTTSVGCSYSVSPTSATVPSSGDSRPVTITTAAGCPWTAQSFADWITVAPASGTGPGTVTYTAAAGTIARSGSLVVANVPVTVTQSAPLLPDLLPVTPLAGNDYCRLTFVNSGGTFVEQLLVNVANFGNGSAAASTTQVVFNPPTGKPVTAPTNPIPAGGVAADVPFPTPGSCSSSGCTFDITVNSTNSVAEGPQPAASANNTVSGRCVANPGLAKTPR